MSDARSKLEDAVDLAVSEAVATDGVTSEEVWDWLMLIAISYKYKAHQEPDTGQDRREGSKQ